MSGLVSWIPKLFTFFGNASVRHELVEATRMFERFAERMEMRCEKLEKQIQELKIEVAECHKVRDEQGRRLADMQVALDKLKVNEE